LPVFRDDRGMARFERVMLVLSGGGALGAWQAGAYSAMETAGFEPDWVVATGIGAINGAIVAGNPPRRRVGRLRNFWGALAPLLVPGRKGLLRRFLGKAGAGPDHRRLQALLADHIDFTRINAGTIRLSLAARHAATGSEVVFDNDRQVLGPEHVLAAGGIIPTRIEGELYASEDTVPSAPVQLLDGVPPADTLCFVLDCFDPEPGRVRGGSRSRQLIAAFRRRHDLRRALGIIAENLPAELRADGDIASSLALGSMATMNLVHLVHEVNPALLPKSVADYAPQRVTPRWRAGELDMAASLARPALLAPPPRRSGVVVHELRGGTAQQSS
jgi:NTE family protein